MLHQKGVATPQQQTHCGGTIVVFATDVTEAVRAWPAIEHDPHDQRDTVFVVLVGQASAKSAPVTRLAASDGRPVGAEDPRLCNAQVRIWREEDGPVTYTEQFVARISDFVAATSATLAVAPDASEQQTSEFLLGLAVSEAIRRIGSRCGLSTYLSAETPLSSVVTEPDLASHDGAPVLSLAMVDNGSEARHQPVDDTPDFAQNAPRHLEVPIPCTPPDNCCAPISGIRRRQFPHRSNSHTKSPLVSVVIRSADRAELSVSWTRIATQTHDSIEVLLIDVNGRREFETPILCGSFPVRIISSGRHLSRGEAANAGLDAAGGEYTVFLDDDDWYYPDHIATLVHALEVGQPALAAYSGVACCTSSGTGAWETARIFNDSFDPDTTACRALSANPRGDVRQQFDWSKATIRRGFRCIRGLGFLDSTQSAHTLSPC